MSRGTYVLLFCVSIVSLLVSVLLLVTVIKSTAGDQPISRTMQSTRETGRINSSGLQPKPIEPAKVFDREKPKRGATAWPPATLDEMEEVIHRCTPALVFSGRAGGAPGTIVRDDQMRIIWILTAEPTDAERMVKNELKQGWQLWSVPPFVLIGDPALVNRIRKNLGK